MFPNRNFTVYKSSAGSGKTYTLVKEYLKIALGSDQPDRYRNILAITFTNKAANEMKERIIGALTQCASNEPFDMLDTICIELNKDESILRKRAAKTLEHILHHYADFAISTIDKFVHKIIRTFAYDLKIPINFEVEMDAISLLNEAVDVLISKIGTDKKLTKLLIDYSLDKTDDDKSWDISRDLNDFARILLNEDDIKNAVSASEASISYSISGEDASRFLAAESSVGNFCDGCNHNYADYEYKPTTQKIEVSVAANASAIAPASRDFLRIYPPVVVVVEL